MNFKGNSCIFLSLVVVGCFCFQALSETEVDSEIHKQLKNLSLEEKVGQLFIFGFPGKRLNAKTRKMLDELKPGGLIVFGRNIQTPKQVGILNHQLQAHAIKATGIPLHIMVDQEGGVVSRIKTRPLPPSALALGMTDNLDLAYRYGKTTGLLLRSLGFTQNLAPVADISSPLKSSFSGNRSFGKNPLLVAQMVNAVSKGMIDADILPTLKHFPGHGQTTQDSHKTLPVKNLTKEELIRTDIVPFRSAISGIDNIAVMSAHIAYPKIDGSHTPATFSNRLIEGLLRSELGHDGLTITDDLEMAGASGAKGIGQRAVDAIKAGNDMVMVVWRYSNQKHAIRAVVNAVKKGIISLERLDKSVLRVLSSKYKIQVKKHYGEFSERSFDSVYASYLRQLVRQANEVAQINLAQSLVNYPKLESSIEPNQKVVVFSADYRFTKQFEKGLNRSVRYFPLRRRRAPPQFARELSLNDFGIFYVSGNGTAKIAESIPDSIKKRVLVVNAAHPGVLKKNEHFMGVVNVNGRNSSIGKIIGAYLNKDEQIKLRTPARTGKYSRNLGGSKRHSLD